MTFDQALQDFRTNPSREAAREVLSLCHAHPTRYAQLYDDDEAMIQWELTDDHDDELKSLAEHYAEAWNALEDAGMEPSDEALWQAETELEGGEWVVYQDTETHEWQVEHVDGFDEPKPVVRNARTGEVLRYDWITIGGHSEEPDKKHVGGFPVEVDSDGTIIKSRAPGLQGKHLTDVKGNIGKKKTEPTKEPETHEEEVEEKPKWDSKAKAVRLIAATTGLEKNDIIHQIAQIAIKTGLGSAKIAGRMAKTLGLHALGTLNIGRKKDASLVLDLIDDVLGKGNRISDQVVHGSGNDKPNSAVLDAADALFGKNNPLSTAHYRDKPKKKEEPKERSLILDAIDAVAGKDNPLTKLAMSGTEEETRPQGSKVLDAIDAIAGKGNPITEQIMHGPEKKQSSMLLDLWDAIAGKGNKITDFVMKLEQDGDVLRYETVRWIEGKSKKSGKISWKHPVTGEIRYQPKMPGDKSGRKKAVRTEPKTPKVKATTKKQQSSERAARGPVDVAALKEKLSGFEHAIDAPATKSAKASFRALMKNHGEHVMHRIEELADDAIAGLGNAKTPEAKGKLALKLAQYQQMLGWADAGVKPKSSVQTDNADKWGTKAQPYYRPGANPTVDNVITRDGKNGEQEVLLIQRKEGTTEGGKWALPGGFHDTDAKKGEPWKPGHETAKEAALRELAEETGLDAKTLQSHMTHIGEYEGNGRDPRDNKEAWSKSNAFKLHLTPELAEKAVAGQDDAQDAKWVPVSKIKDMPMAFDHGKILEDAFYRFPTANEVKEGTDSTTVRKQLIQQVIGKFGGDEQKYSSYSTEQLRKMLDGGTKGETNDDTTDGGLGSEGESPAGSGGDAGASVGTDAGQASTGELSGAGGGHGNGLPGLPAGEGGTSVGVSGRNEGAGTGSIPSEGTGVGIPPADTGNNGHGGAGGSGGSGSGVVGEGAAQDAVESIVGSKPTPETPTDLAAGNFRYTTHEFMQGGLKSKFNRNVEAIRTLQKIKSEGRTSATPEEQEILAKYIGWGQFPAAFKGEYEHDPDAVSWEEKNRLKEVLSEEEWDARFSPKKWAKEKTLLEGLLSDEEYKSARRSTLNAHYTHPDIVEAHWKMAKRLGYKGGRFLETSAGVGYYFGMMPADIAGRTRGAAVELDSVTADICKLLYPKVHVENKGFEAFSNPDGFYDLVASNVPFGAYHVFDKKYAKYNAHIHDYFFLKSLDLAKPGGLVMHVTSTGTMDKKDSKIRKAMMEKADLVAAIRFPGSAHKENAGTEVVTDLIILRKKNPNIPEVTEETPKEANPKKPGYTGTTIDSLGRLYHWKDGKRVPGPSWDEITTVPDPAGGEPIEVNKYFAEHPEQILGTLDRTGTMYHGDAKNVTPSADYKERLEDAINRLPKNVMATDVKQEEPAERIEADQAAKEGANVIKGGKLFIHQQGMLTERKGVSKQDLAKAKAQLEIRDVRNELITAMREGADSAEPRKRLNDLYDAFVKEHGFINDKKNRKILGDDPDAPNIFALEKWDEKTKTATKADILARDTIRSGRVVEKANNITEAIGVSLHMHGVLDMDYMAKLLGQTTADVGSLLANSGLAFNDPKEGWKQSDQYLSGNVRRKLLDAKAAAAVDPAYQPNVDALEKVQPVDIEPEKIRIKLGSKWVPTTDIQNYVSSLIGGRPDQYDVRVNPVDSSWHIDIARSRDAYLLNSELAEMWKTKEVGFMRIINAAMNGKSINIENVQEVTGIDGKTYKEKRPNKEATDAVNDKISAVREKFSKEWVMEDDERRDRLCRYYNDNFNNVVPIKYNGAHQTFPGLNPSFTPYPHQKDAVWQIVTTGKGLLAHEVGTGKSATMFMAAMELRRLGLAKKPVISCLKANIDQLEKEARLLYPEANIFSTAGAFDPEKRAKTLAQIATGDYDMIFMTHEHLDFMKMKKETQAMFIEKELSEVLEAKAAAAEKDGKDAQSVKDIEKFQLNLEAKLKDALDPSKKDDTITFEDTGIDQLFVDEAHDYKSLPSYTKNPVKGVPTSRSDRATNMYMRTNWMLDKNNDRGVVFATGTPVSNSMAELYVMQKFLQERDLKERGISNFDDWANLFGETETKQEYSMTGEYKNQTRFSRFVNIPELLQISRQMMDVVRVDNTFQEAADQNVPEEAKPKGPGFTGDTVDKLGRKYQWQDGVRVESIVKRPDRVDSHVVSPPLPGSQEFLKSLQERARNLRRDNRKEDNMLKICNDARKYSVDMRLVKEDNEDFPDSKLNLAVDNVVKMWKQYPDKTQFIFSDVGVHESKKSGNKFTVYDDIVNKLVDAGVPRDKVINFAKLTENGKAAAVERLRTGDALLAVGGTKTLGTGVNAQKHLIGIHHVDVPWKPSDIEQREGRGWRSGNLNKEINIVKYVSQPMDQFFWGVVGRKAKFIKDVIVDKNPPREMEEEDDEASPDRMEAIASGDERLLEKVNLQYDVKKLSDSKRRHDNEQRRLQQSVTKSNMQITDINAKIKKTEEFREYLKKQPEGFKMDIGGKVFDKRPEAEAALETAIKDSGELKSWEERDLGEILGMRVFRKGAKTFFETPEGDVQGVGDSLKSIEYNIKFLTRDDAYKAELENINQGLPKIQAAIGKKFMQEEELTKKAARIKEIETALAEESKAKLHQEIDTALDDLNKDKETIELRSLREKHAAKHTIPAMSEVAHIHDLGDRVRAFGKKIHAPKATIKLPSGKEVEGNAVGPFVIHKTGTGKHTSYNVVHEGTGLNAVRADTQDVAKAAAHAMAQKGDWSFTDSSGFGGEAKEHGGKVARAVSRGDLTALADLAGIGGSVQTDKPQRNSRMPWNFLDVLNEFRSQPNADRARKVLRYCETSPHRYANLTDGDESHLTYELTPDEGGEDHFKALANFYMEHWNQLNEAGLEPSDEGLEKAADELSGGDWVVFWDDDDHEWRMTHADAAPHVVKYAAPRTFTYKCPHCGSVAYADSPVTNGRFNGYAICSRCGHSFATVNRHQAVGEVLHYAARHAPKGGVTIGGKFYNGGKFIPGEALAKATPQERKTLDVKTKAEGKSTEAPKWNAASKRKKGLLDKAVDTFDDHVTNPIMDEVDNAVSSVKDWYNEPGAKKRADDTITEIKRRVPETIAEIRKRVIALNSVAEAEKKAEAIKPKVEAEVKQSFSKLPQEAKEAVADVIEKNKKSLMAKVGDVAADVAGRTMSGVAGIGLATLGGVIGGTGVAAWMSNPFWGMMGFYDGIFDLAGMSMKSGFDWISYALRRPGTEPEKKEPKYNSRGYLINDTPDIAHVPEAMIAKGKYSQDGSPLRYENETEEQRIKKLAEEFYTGIIRDLAKVWKPEWSKQDEEEETAKRYSGSILEELLRYAKPRYSVKKPKGNWTAVPSKSKTQKWVIADDAGTTTVKQPAKASPKPKWNAKTSVQTDNPKETVIQKRTRLLKPLTGGDKSQFLEDMKKPSSSGIVAKETAFQNEFLKMTAEKQSEVLKTLEAAAKKYDQKKAVETFTKSHIFSLMSPSQQKQAEEEFKALDLPDQEERLERLKGMSKEEQAEAIQRLTEAQRPSAKPKSETIEWGGVKGGRYKPEEHDDDIDPASLAKMSEDQLWRAFLAEQGGNAHLQPHQWTKKAHILMDAWKKKAAEEDASPEALKGPTPSVDSGFLEGAGDHLKHFAGRLGGAAAKVGFDLLQGGMKAALDRSGYQRCGHRGGVLRYAWVEVPTKAKTKKWKDSGTGRTRYQPTMPGAGRGGGVMSPTASSTAATVGTLARTKERGKREVDRHKLDQLLANHSHHELDAGEMKKTKSTFRALVGHHKDLVVHRLEELANGMQASLEKLPDNAENAETRKNIGRKLRGISHMVGWADAKKGQGTVKQEEPANWEEANKAADNVENKPTVPETKREEPANWSEANAAADSLEKKRQPESRTPGIKSGGIVSKINDKKYHLPERGRGVNAGAKPKDPEIQNLQAGNDAWEKQHAAAHAEFRQQAQDQAEIEAARKSLGIKKKEPESVESQRDRWVKDLGFDSGKELMPKQLRQKGVGPGESDEAFQARVDKQIADEEAAWQAEQDAKSKPAPPSDIKHNDPAMQRMQDNHDKHQGIKPSPVAQKEVKASWNEPAKRVKLVEDTLNKVSSGKASKKDLKDITAAINAKLSPNQKESFWKRVVSKIRKPAQMAILAVSMVGYVNAGVGEAKDIAAGNKDPIDKIILMHEMNERAKGMAGKTKEVREKVAHISYQRS